jgi:hypothetical protein
VIEIFVRGFLDVISFTFALLALCVCFCRAHRNACQSFFGGGCVHAGGWDKWRIIQIHEAFLSVACFKLKFSYFDMQKAFEIDTL